MLETGTMLAGRYQITRLIGKGGMSTVYQARDTIDGKLLAVKDVSRTGTEANQSVEQKLAVEEGRMLMQLNNPHLPRIYDIIENPDSFMLVMDFVEGESLDKTIAREGAQQVDRVLNWGMQICECFHYLHNQPTPIIYRDMKPANVILQPNGHIMMIDFGTARTQKVGVSMAADTICIGTAGFAAPEQFGGIGQSTARTDIFCLGATLYNMVTGHSPCDNPKGILPLEHWNPALANSPIAHIIYKCTRNDPDARYQSAMELHEDLRLASIGAFRVNGKSGRLNFQKQDLKGANGGTGVLSGLLSGGMTSAFRQNGKSGGLKKEAQPVPQSAQQMPAHDNSWQPVYQQTAATAVQPAQQPQQQAQQQPQVANPWRKLTLIAAVIAVGLLVIAALMAFAGQVAIAAVFMIIALGGGVLAIVGAVQSR